MRTCLLLLALSLSHVAAAEVVDRVVVVVEDQLVLDSDIQLEEAITPLDPLRSPFWDRPKAAPEDRMVEVAMIRHLAGDVAFYEAPEEDVRARTELVRANFLDSASWKAFLRGWGLDEHSLAAVVKRRLTVERYLARNLRVSTEDRDAWLRACDELLAGQRSRLRIRSIALRGSGG